AGADPAVYSAAAPGSEMAIAMEAAKRDAGPEILNATLILPIILVLAFTGLVIYMRSRKKAETLTPANG
ncbi:MAG: MFS transporter, partial [Flavitalea sp.]